jgi:hypothetical protein
MDNSLSSALIYSVNSKLSPPLCEGFPNLVQRQGAESGEECSQRPAAIAGSALSLASLSEKPI